MISTGFVASFTFNSDSKITGIALASGFRHVNQVQSALLINCIGGILPPENQPQMFSSGGRMPPIRL